MAELQQNKRVVTTTSKALIWLAVIEFAVIVILVLSGFVTINPYLLFLALLIGAAAVFFFFRKPKELDAYQIMSLCRRKHAQEAGYGLDVRDFQAIPLSPTLTFCYFPYAGYNFWFNGKKIVGIQIKHINRAIREQEKSRIFETVQKTTGAEARAKQLADAFGIDRESLGLE